MLRNSLVTAATLAITLLSTAAGAQGRLIGFTSGNGPGPSIQPRIQRQTLCGPSTTVCPVGLAPASVDWAGGSCYDARFGSVWSTQGTRMEERLISDCSLRCSVPAFLTLPSTTTISSVATGLAMSECRDELYQLESVRGRAAMHVRHARSCPLNVLRSCAFALPTPNHIAGAIAIDEERDQFMYAASIFGPTTVTGPMNTVLVARYSDPCNIICSFPVVSCGPARLGPIKAMTYDPCGDFLYCSDGNQTVVLQRSTFALCSFTEVRCCTPSPSSQDWHGFDIEPAHARPVGQTCIDNFCRNCPLELVTDGDASIGNPFFAIRVRGAQDGGFAVLAFGGGPCQVPGFPLFCGRLHVGNPFFFPAQALVGSTVGGCDATTAWPIPIPKLWGLCDLSICVQALVVCPPTPISPGGINVTNALEIPFSS